MKKLNPLAIIIILTIMLSCQHGKQDAENKQSDTIEANSLTAKKANGLYQKFPSAEEILPSLCDSKLGFRENIVLKQRKNVVEDNTLDKTILLGYYIADIAYLNIFEKKIELISYLHSFIKLCEDLNITISFDNNTLDKMYLESFQFDSIHKLYTYNYNQLIQTIESNKDKSTINLLTGAMLIEILHLSMNSVSDDNVFIENMNLIADQKAIIEFYINYSKNRNPSKLDSEIYTLYTVINEFDSEIPKKNNTTDKNKIIIGRDYKLVYDENILKIFKSELYTIRNTYLQPLN